MNRATALLLAAALAGCDWVDNAFLNSIPLQGTRTDDMYVYIAYDGLGLSTVHEAMAKGAFAGPRWQATKLFTNFPGTSDASWTRILRSGKMQGYEYEYYDPPTDSLVNAGLLGLAKHILPALSESLDFEAAYLRAFDYRSNGYSHNFEAYSDTWVSLGDTLDELFFALDGRAQTERVFIGYLLEGDVLGHVARPEDCTAVLLRLAERIEQFRKAHPERTFHFTIVSDHGMDFTGMPYRNLLLYEEELPKVGITPVESLAGRDPSEGVFAVPILHVRLMYFALHTHPALVGEAGRRVSELESVDFAVGRLGPGQFGVWSAGRLTGTFDYADSAYTLKGDFTRFGVPAGVTRATDEELFDLTRRGDYPDFFYRMRTALSDVGVEYPAEVLVSCKSGWSSAGAIPRPADLDALITAGTHGGARASGVGVLLTDERELPDGVRADAFLDVFPHAAEHLRERGVAVHPTDADAARPHLR